MKSSELAPLLFTVYLAAASGHSPALPCFAAFLALVCFSGLFAFTQFFFQTPLFLKYSTLLFDRNNQPHSVPLQNRLSPARNSRCFLWKNLSYNHGFSLDSTVSPSLLFLSESASIHNIPVSSCSYHLNSRNRQPRKCP